MEIQNTLPTNGLSIIADVREPDSIERILEKLGVALTKKQLTVADYICSDRVAVERKTAKDFVGSILNQRVFRQVEELTEAYSHSVLLIEGNPDSLFLERNVSPNAIRGAMASIAIDYRIPILWSANPEETANMLYRFAWREQMKSGRTLQIRSNKKAKNMNEKQEFLVAGLPHVSNMLSQRLLKHFGSPQKIFSASVGELQQVDKIGRKKAKEIWDLLNGKYED